jgi:uncharacterized protein (DUF1330 family)
MPAYFVVELEVTNMEAMTPYREAVGATLAQYGASSSEAARRN